MIQKVGNASLLSNLTTAAGFGYFHHHFEPNSCRLRSHRFYQYLYRIFICLILIPSVFSYLPVPDTKQTKHLYNPFINKVIDKLIYLVINRRHTVYYITIVLVIAGIFGITLMKTTGYMVDDLKETDPIRQDLIFFESNFDGLMPLEVTDFGKPEPVFKLSNLEKLDRLNTELSQDPDLSRALSVVEAGQICQPCLL